MQSGLCPLNQSTSLELLSFVDFREEGKLEHPGKEKLLELSL